MVLCHGAHPGGFDVAVTLFILHRSYFPPQKTWLYNIPHHKYSLAHAVCSVLLLYFNPPYSSPPFIPTRHPPYSLLLHKSPFLFINLVMRPLSHPLLEPTMPETLMSSPSVPETPAQYFAETPFAQGSKIPLDGPAQPTTVQTSHPEETVQSVVTVVAGHDRIELDIEENTLRKVPFFKTLLDAQGQLIHKFIYMPDEHPDVVCAVLEFIYEGSYSCNIDYQRAKYHQDAADLGIIASENCLEKLFHLQVFLLAEKIGYRELGCYSCKSTRYKMLEAIEKLMIWRIWYQSTGRLGDAPRVFASQGAPAVRQWVNELLEKYPEAIKSVVKDVPTLAFELLKAASTPGN